MSRPFLFYLNRLPQEGDRYRSEQEKETQEKLINETRNLLKLYANRAVGFSFKIKEIRTGKVPDDNGEYTITNLCTGSDLDGFPGPSVSMRLEREMINFGGPSSDFWMNTIDKSRFRACMEYAKIPYKSFEFFYPGDTRELKFPLIINPGDSYIRSTRIIENEIEFKKESSRHLSVFPLVITSTYEERDIFPIYVSGRYVYATMNTPLAAKRIAEKAYTALNGKGPCLLYVARTKSNCYYMEDACCTGTMAKNMELFGVTTALQIFNSHLIKTSAL